jgi:cobalt/nickel transport system permease protein
MHVPDGFIDAPTAAACALAAGAGVTVAARKAAGELDERRIPLAGTVAAYVFAVQMLNFPVASGTSGHLLGGALAAVLVGPWVGALCITVVLALQALVFADGGLSALGVNIVLMAFVATFVAYGVYVPVRRLIAGADAAVPLAAAVAAWCSVVAASVAFFATYAIGGTADVPLRTLAASMIGVHGLIGVGEAVITGLTVAAVVATRPDLLHGTAARPAAASPSEIASAGSLRAHAGSQFRPGKQP